MGVAGEFTGKISEKYNTVEYYFKLKKTNEALVSENVQLRGLLRHNYEGADTLHKLVVDSIRIDSLLSIQRFKYYDAKVVNSFVSTQNNYLTIHRGINQGVRKDMAVISPQGIVGRVVNAGPNYSVVMSALHRDFKVNSMLKKSGERGSVSWSGESPLYLTLKDIPKSAQVAKGDTVMTSNVSDIYPPGIMVGTILEVVDDKSSNFYTLKLKPATNFFTVEFVYVIEDLQKEERQKVEETIKKGQ